ncbi:centrosomal protein of 131 kDa isoform X1 [Lucilia cuprina]|uniref:centrosomal protein of 131 kDa isoform X1 n=1 Tax=Lucilia cuprina TaxID=7375 RepID=UPI001F057258|nr:centrosomal protein of 131 kDa isoform X1 [Lucilia cuprina]
MDLSLKGSQINLVTRQKPKPKYSSQINLLKPATRCHSRPRSASFFERRSYTSLYLRPQSADPKFGRNFASPCGSYTTQDSDFTNLNLSKRQQKKFQSVSSSNLLKLLLDEPIKRSWLCKDSANNSEGDASDLSSSRKSGSYSSLNKPQYNERYMSTVRNPTRKISSTSSYSMLHVNKDKQNKEDYYSYHKTAAKPDLPGRVSFSKPSSTLQLPSDDNDSSDYENLNTYVLPQSSTKQQEDISAPGPIDYSFKSKTLESTAPTQQLHKELSSLSLKKSVHFGSSGNGEEVLAETFEYPKCPSENCSCSTRSSSSGSLQESPSPKCYCASPTCKYSMEPFNKLNEQDQQMATTKETISSNTTSPKNSKISLDLVEAEESQVIRDYKNAVGEQLDNSVVKNLLEETKPKAASNTNLNNFELPSYLNKYSNPTPTVEALEKPNNLTEPKTLNSNYKTEIAKKDFLKMDNKLESPTKKSSSETVINNYLKVAGSSAAIIKKKENINNTKTETKKTLATANNSLSKSKPKTTSIAPLTQNNIKKAKSFGNIREDSNLHEFNIDKIDTWMSMHEQTSQAISTSTGLNQHTSLDESFEKFTQETLEAMSALDPEEVEEEEEDEEDGKNSESQDDSTYDEIVSVIKEIEEDKKKDNLAERVNSEMNLKLSTTPSIGTPHSPPETAKGKESPDKYKDILSYLDNVEDSCEKTLMETRRSMPDTNRSEVEFVVEPDIAEDVPKLSDLLMLPNHQLARRVIALSLRANELANAVQLSKEHVIKVRTEKQKSIRSEKSNAANRMKEQKKHYEAIVKRHQGFIEQLLKDKGSLCEKVAALTRRLESQNQAWEHKLETEITRVKENTMAGEKIRRERWVRENTKKIKELTVKGLEAEINKMNCNHQKEITELKRAHQQQLLDALEEERLKHEQIEKTIRESCAQDRESIISKERNAIRERFERQLEEERNSFDEQKQKLMEEHQLEKQRLQNELKQKEVELQTKRSEWQQEKDAEMEQAISELQDKMSKQEEKFLNRLNTMEKQYEADFEIWKTEYENKCKVQQVEKENNIRQHYRNERDRQIDAIVQRMDAEALKNNEEFENKISRLREKYEKDLQELESVEKSVREKYAETRSKLAESDAQARNFQAEIKQLQLELEHSKKMCSEYLTERDQLRENLRSEIQNEVQSLKLERDQEIQKIHKRVQQAIEKKDATIDILQKENGALRERCLKLEAVIRQQRKDYCVK